MRSRIAQILFHMFWNKPKILQHMPQIVINFVATHLPERYE